MIEAAAMEGGKASCELAFLISVCAGGPGAGFCVCGSGLGNMLGAYPSASCAGRLHQQPEVRCGGWEVGVGVGGWGGEIWKARRWPWCGARVQGRVRGRGWFARP